MDDIISHGPTGEPSRLTRAAATVLVLATLIVIAVVATGHLTRHDPAAEARRHAAVIAAGPVQLAGLGSEAARMLDGDRPSHMPSGAGDHADWCGHVGAGNHDFQLATMAACH